MFLPATREPGPGDMYTFTIASLVGGRAPDHGPMNIARVIHVERSVTPVIFVIFGSVETGMNLYVRTQTMKIVYYTKGTASGLLRGTAGQGG